MYFLYLFGGGKTGFSICENDGEKGVRKWESNWGAKGCIFIIIIFHFLLLLKGEENEGKTIQFSQRIITKGKTVN